MKQKRTRIVALLLALLLLLPSLGGCAQIGIYEKFFTGTGTKDPAAGVLPPPAVSTTSLSLGYDESCTVDGRFLALEDVETADYTLLEITEETESAFTIRARGVGRATLVYAQNGEEVRLPITVRPARLAVFFLLGEEDARGKSEADPALLRATDGLVYYTFPEHGSSSRVDPSSVADYLPDMLIENQISQTGGELYYATNELTTAGKGRRAAIAAPLAYKWVEQTGEHVWVINLAKEHCSINDLLPTAPTVPGAANEFATLSAVAEGVFSLLRYEYGAGHFTHARTGWFLSQGETDSTMSAEAYLAALQTLSVSLADTLTFSVGDTEHTPTFGGLLGCRAVRRNDYAIAAMSGPRTAQLCAAGMGGELQSVHLLTDTAGAWYSDAAVSAHFSQYDRHKFLIYYGYEPPKTMAELYGEDGSLTAAAANETAALAVESLLYLSGLRQMPTGEAQIDLLAYNGTDTVGEILTLSYGETCVTAVPRVTPLWRAKSVGASVSLATDGEGKTLDLCRLIGAATGDEVTVSLSTANGETETKTLSVERYMRFAFSDHRPLVITGANGNPAFGGFGRFFACGYIDKNSGAFTPYVGFDWRYGWLYDGKNIWAGHGGVNITNNCVVGPLDQWDAGYSFQVPASGEATFSFDQIHAGLNDYLFAICVNGKPVWPTAAENASDNAVFYTVRKDATLEEINKAIADLSLSLNEGDVVTFVFRRIRNGVTAEGSVLPVIVIR
ncbi:MAG: hypothetical protein IJY20_08900 [Clostridia bacterium]|nr:hypothetical protein [Clostridia bacterium]